MISAFMLFQFSQDQPMTNGKAALEIGQLVPDV